MNVLHQISHNAQSAHACWCNKAVIVWLCVCTGDNPLDYPPVHTHRPYNNLHLMFLLQLLSSETCLKAFVHVPVITVDSHLFITIDLNLVYFESYLRNGDASNFETHRATA